MSSVTQRSRANRTDRSGEHGKEKTESIDFKMVTFSLGGKDYGIDIMKVKEIARLVNFTYVPNTPSFVRGVYNLRGEIISIIDLRALFNLPFVQKPNSEEESGLILRLDSNLIGIVVDKIDKVVGISSESIQPPHPIFGDINIKYISGVVENDGRLYIILDAERILGKPEANDSIEALLENNRALVAEQDLKPPPQAMQQNTRPEATGLGDDTQFKTFVIEELKALENFYVGEVNQAWFDLRFAEWKKFREGKQLQLRSQDDARAFLEGFLSPCTGQLWTTEYLDRIRGLLPDKASRLFNVWNPGCGRGFETYSLAVCLKNKFPDSQVKIWASDKDLLNISSAPNLVFAEKDVPDYYKDHVTQGKNGLSFSQKIKEMILFEYHDVGNHHALPPMDMVLARDLLSWMKQEARYKFFDESQELLKSGGIIVLGAAEKVPERDSWKTMEKNSVFFAVKS